MFNADDINYDPPPVNPVNKPKRRLSEENCRLDIDHLYIIYNGKPPTNYCCAICGKQEPAIVDGKHVKE